MRNRMRGGVAVGLAAAMVLAVAPTTASASETGAEGFVTTEGTGFVLDGEPFLMLGSNNYYPMYESEEMADSVFEAAEAAGFTTMRVWGSFAIGSPGDSDAVASVADKDKGVYFQYWDDEAGAPAFNDGATGLEHLDMVIERAEAHGIRLILPLTNNWGAFGGMDQYLVWAEAAGEDVDSHDDFYTNATVRGWYQDWVDHLLARVNTRTGVAYKDDPTIMTWELANEPRCIGDGGPADASWGTGLFPRDQACAADTITPWIEEMSAHIKDLDDHHMVATGDEGFFDDPDGADWQYDGSDGVDTVAWAAVDTIDYLSYHLYPDHWGTDAAWGSTWIAEHNAAAASLGKPAVLGEFGWQDKATRNVVYRQWLDTQRETGGAGTLYWLLSDTRDDGTLYPDYDGFRVTCPSAVCTTISNFGAQASDPDAVLDPVADDDDLTVDHGAAAELDVTANDIAYGTVIDHASVDIDPSAPGRQTSLTLADAEAEVSPEGTVTVTPAAGFAGEIPIPYVVSDGAGRRSNIAVVTVTVRPSEDSWTVLEGFDDASRWSCTGAATVSSDEGVGVFANPTGAWQWCTFAPATPLDLSQAGLFRFDFLGTDAGVNPEIAFVTGEDLTWNKYALDTGTWSEPRVGDDAPTVTIPDGAREALSDTRQIAFGVQAGTHRFDDVRISGALTETPPLELEGFEGDISGWSCAVTEVDGHGEFAIASSWEWCTLDLPTAVDLSTYDHLAFDLIGTDSGVNPSLVVKAGPEWTWTELALDVEIWDQPTTAVASFSQLTDEQRALLTEVHTIGLGMQQGTHVLDSIVAGFGEGGGDDGDGEPGTPVTGVLESFDTASAWTCDAAGAAVAAVEGKGVITQPTEWTWCNFRPGYVMDLSANTVLEFDLVATDGSPSPEVAFQTGDGWTWSQFPLSRVLDGAPGTAALSLEGLGIDLTRVQSINIGIQAGVHTIDDLRVRTGVVAPTLTDIATNPFKVEITWLAQQGITQGWSNGDGTSSFRPLANVNRDQMAAFLYRMAGSPQFEDPATPTFSDVPTSHVFYTEIEWLNSTGVTNGWTVNGQKQFRPTAAVNRDVMAAFLYRFAGSPEFTAPATSPFLDVPTSHVFYEEIAWLADQEISAGWSVPGGAQFRPTAPVKRDVMAAFLYRYAALDL